MPAYCITGSGLKGQKKAKRVQTNFDILCSAFLLSGEVWLSLAFSQYKETHRHSFPLISLHLFHYQHFTDNEILSF